MRKTSLIILSLCLIPFLAFGQNSNEKYKPLINAAKKSSSDALVVLKDGEKILEYYSDSQSQKIQSMSVTKSVVGLAVVKLLSDGTIDSLDTPVATYYPEWRQGQKQNITIRHLMNHTSGLQNVANANKEVNPAPDVLQLGLCASVVNKPGTNFSYNNKAVNILSGIIKKETGKPIDEYLGDSLFNQMGITDFEWGTDEKGNHPAMAGLSIHGGDLAKIGQLVLENGSWEGTQLINQQWIEKLVAQGSSHTRTYGLLWWRVPEEEKYVIGNQQIANMRKSGMNENMLTKVKEIKGEYDSQGAVVNAIMGQFNSRENVMEFRKATLGKNIKPYTKSLSGPIVGYKASGDAGQFLTIYPKPNIVAVRMVEVNKDYNQKTDFFANFPRMVYKLGTS